MRTTLPIVCLFSVLLLVTLKLCFWLFLSVTDPMPKTRSSARARGRGRRCSQRRSGPPATNGPPASNFGEGDGAESGGIPSTLGQFLPHHLSGGPTPTGQPRPCHSPSPHIPLH